MYCRLNTFGYVPVFVLASFLRTAASAKSSTSPYTGKYILKRYIQKSSKYHTCQSYQVILSQYLLQLSDQCLHDLSTKISEGKKMKEDIFEEKNNFQYMQYRYFFSSQLVHQVAFNHLTWQQAGVKIVDIRNHWKEVKNLESILCICHHYVKVNNYSILGGFCFVMQFLFHSNEWNKKLVITWSSYISDNIHHHETGSHECLECYVFYQTKFTFIFIKRNQVN